MCVCVCMSERMSFVVAVSIFVVVVLVGVNLFLTGSTADTEPNVLNRLNVEAVQEGYRQTLCVKRTSHSL